MCIDLDNSNDLKIDILRKLCDENKIKWTLHALKRMRQRRLTADTIIDAIMKGEIIERYPDDTPCPSCLILYVGDIPIHVVTGTDNQSVYLITAYIPNTSEWSENFKIRKV